ncbi:MAG TPA: ParA family protein [Rhodospirillales bacterium]|nr:ParA family protein [Rhodospirillales bacterium]
MPDAIKRLLVSSPKGGVGKTTLVRNLAVAAALGGARVMMADLDKQRSLSEWWSRRPDQLVPISCLAAGIADGERVIEAADGHDLLIIDTPTAVEQHPAAVKALLLAADFVLVPTGVSSDDINSVCRWMELVQGLQRPSAFVLTRVNRRARSFLEAKRRLAAAAGRTLPIEVPLYEDFNLAADTGTGIMEIRGASGADDMRALWLCVAREMWLPNGR